MENKNKKIYCGQTSTPIVDETLLKCDKFTLSDCIIYEDSIPFLDIVPNSNMNMIITSIINKIKDLHIDYDNLVSNLSRGDYVNREDYTYSDIINKYTETNGNLVLPLQHISTGVLIVIINSTVLSLEHYSIQDNLLHIVDIGALIKEDFPISVIYKY